MFARLLQVCPLVLATLPLLACAGQSHGEEAAPVRRIEPAPGLSATRAAHQTVALRRAEAFTPVIAAAPERSRPRLLVPAQGDGLIVSRAGGIVLLDAQLRELAVLSAERGRHLRLAGDQLYYFAYHQPVLRALDLNSGETRTVAELTRFKDACFGAGRPTDPIDFVQSEADLTISGEVLCLDVMDRNANMAAMTRNFRIDLVDGTVEQRMIAYLGGDACGQVRERELPRLCTPAAVDRSAVIELAGPSGRWSYYPDSSRGETGDYIYALARVVDRTQRRSYSIVGRRLRPLREGNAGNPIGACLVPVESGAAWLAGSDVLVLDGCRDRLTVVHPPDKVEYLKVDGYAVLPR